LRKTLTLVVVLAALAVGGTAHAATWTVNAGELTKPPAGTPKGSTLNQFFPGRLQVNAGDKVTFKTLTFHTISYLGGKLQGAPGAIADPQKTLYEGITAADGAEFYFNGLTKFINNPAVFAPYGPKSFSGKTPANALLFSPNGKKPGTVTYTFPKFGQYAVLCQIHPGMKMVVDVKAKGAQVQTPEDVKGVQKVETDAAWAKAKAFANPTIPANTVYMGIGGKTTLLDFKPDVLRVKAGTTVNFVNKAPSEIHNVAFGPLKYMEKFSKETDLFPMGPGQPNQVTPVFVYGTDPTPYNYDGTNHGNGFFVTPLRDGIPGALPNASRITFPQPGKYHYICFLHGPDMAGDIVVTQ
jgi:plastocyanin